jgi:transcription termination factor Rho
MTESVAPTTGTSPRSDLNRMLMPELKELAHSLGISGVSGMRKPDLLAAIRNRQSERAQSGSSATAVSAPDAAPAAASQHDSAHGPATAAAEPGGQASPSQASAQPEESTQPQLAAQPQESPQPAERPEDQGREQRGERREGGQRDREGGQRDREGGQRDRASEQGRGEESDRGDRGDDNDRGDRGRRRNRDRNRNRNRDGRPDRGGGRGEPQISEDDVLIPVAGILDILDNYAFVRTSGYLPGPNDVYVSMSMVKRNRLRKGDAITGAIKQPDENQSGRREKYNPLARIDTVNGAAVDEVGDRPEFGKLTPLYPQHRLRLETAPNNLTTRIIDLVAPIGKGQRGLIVSPPKAGKTMVLQAIANAITTNNPECHLMVVLVDERPEEVTDMQRSVKGEVIASTFDRPAEDHTTVAELAIERAKRLVELGHDVVVLLDSMTRLGRAYNLSAPASGRILSGGVDSAALYPPKKFFGAARNIENGGSLTILATALVETGSKMDEVIFEEFKGTGNMELKLDRRLADKRLFPAVDVDASGTRKEELLMSSEELKIVWKLRRVLHALDALQAIELLTSKLKETSSNYEFLVQVQKTTPTNDRLD